VPIFKYNCENCNETVTVMHASGANITDCDKCETENSLTRLLNKPFINKKVKNNDTENTGELTKKYIEDNRDILEQQKKEIKNRTYDKS